MNTLYLCANPGCNCPNLPGSDFCCAICAQTEEVVRPNAACTCGHRCCHSGTETLPPLAKEGGEPDPLEPQIKNNWDILSKIRQCSRQSCPVDATIALRSNSENRQDTWAKQRASAQ